jgi:chemotaxis protein histidine kinase CheA
MKGGTQAALALGVGYLLGRRRKMRLATMLAVGAATGGAGSLTGAALKRGMKMLGSTEAVGKFAPQLGELADTVRSDLMDAGKAAATAAVTSRIESLTDSLQERAEMVRDPAAAADSAGKAARSGAGKAARTATGVTRTATSATRRPRRGQDVTADEEAAEFNGEEEPYADDLEEPEGYEPEAEAEAEEPEAEEPEAEESEADEPETAPVRRRTTRRRSPVARAGR